MSKYIGKLKTKECKQELNDQDLKLDELCVLLSKVIREKYVQLTGPPYRLRYHTTFLARFNNTMGQEQQRSQSPVMSPTGKEGQDCWR
jgi:hypothetical protein